MSGVREFDLVELLQVKLICLKEMFFGFQPRGVESVLVIIRVEVVLFLIKIA